MRISQAMKATLETKVIMVDSEEFNNVTYAIDKEGKGLWLIADGIVVPIADPRKFAIEMLEVWEHMKPRR